MRAPHGEIVEEMTLTVKTAASETTAASEMTAASVLTAVTETVGMTVNPEVQLEVRRKVSQSSCLKLLFVLSQQGALRSWSFLPQKALDRWQTPETLQNSSLNTC